MNIQVYKHMSQRDLDLKYIESLTDEDIVTGILDKNERITKAFLYLKCYPLFKNRYDRYYTDCVDCIEFINQIYIYLMIPGPVSGKSKLSTFGYGCSLMNWLRIVIDNYCYQAYKKKIPTESIEQNTKVIEPKNPVTIDNKSINRRDVDTALGMMENARYRKLIYYRYVLSKTNEETALLMGIHMDNYYNVHLRAKAQFTNILKQEGII